MNKNERIREICNMAISHIRSNKSSLVFASTMYNFFKSILKELDTIEDDGK